MAQLRMKVWVELIGADSVPQRRDVASVMCDVNGAELEDFCLTLDEGKRIQNRLQESSRCFRRIKIGYA